MTNMISKDIFFEGIVITPLLKAKENFDNALIQAESELEREGALYRFEIVYNLTWKILGEILFGRGLEVYAPREIFRQAFREGFIDKGDLWIDLIDKRISFNNYYDENIPIKLYESLPIFKQQLDYLISKLK